MTPSINAVGFSLNPKQSEMIESKLKRISYADDLIIDLYKNLYQDEGLKNKKQYREYLEKYVSLLPNEEN